MPHSGNPANPDTEAPDGEQGGDPEPEGPGRLSRQRVRPEVRTALALEDAGELEEAARIFEYAGEHGQAAALRLEFANTHRNRNLRLAVLREAGARNRGVSAEGKALHRALAEALLKNASEATGSARRGLMVEAAEALDEASESKRAGEVYERLGMLPRAAHAYERAGAVHRLELVLEALDRQEEEAGRVAAVEREVDEAWRSGQRRHVHALLVTHVRDREQLERAPSTVLARRLADLEARQLRPDRMDLAVETAAAAGSEVAGAIRLIRIRGGSSLTVGRAPDSDLVLPAAGVSRHHVELRIATNKPAPQLVAVDLGTRAGTFWNGAPLEPGIPEPIERAGTLALGASDDLQMTPLTRGGGAVLRAGKGPEVLLFIPRGGSLDVPGIQIPARLEVGPRFPTLVANATVTVRLADQPLGRGRRIDLLVGDRIGLNDRVLEVIR